MPSRAVLRKKQRREAKRKKADGKSHRIVPLHLSGEEDLVETGTCRKRAHDTAAPLPSALTTSLTAAPVVAVPVAKRARREPPPPPAPMPEGLSRKERHRWETNQRLERQMARLNTTAKAVEEMLTDAATQKAASGGMAAAVGGGESSGGGPGEQAEGSIAAAASSTVKPKLRHDPKFKYGTFWRDRKEKRARTLFLGGIPTYFTVKQIMDFIGTVVDSDPNAIDYVDQVGRDVDVVEAVDMLPAKHHSKVKHMYVTMASVPLAGCAAAMLDRYKMEGRELRCNFAADKTQREEAIRRRNAAQR